RFLEQLRGQAASLFIVGDLFEFGFEYRRENPDPDAEVVARLRDLAQSGVRVVLIRGNHDGWLGSGFMTDSGAEVRDSGIEERLAGMRIWLAHGAELDRSFSNRLCQGLFRNRIATRLFGLVPPRLGRRLALAVAHASRVMTPNPGLVRRFQESAAARLAEGFDLVVMGHVHEPCLVPTKHGQYLNTGDWIRHFSYGVLDESGLRLARFIRS
ncbi:MAG: UDP-2,3-diacylglucosamine diphosphatase, partial [candidate division WOR-3 bacterium]